MSPNVYVPQHIISIVTTFSNLFRRKHAGRIKKKKNNMTILLQQEVKIILVETTWPYCFM
jgi:hypothetical protein